MFWDSYTNSEFQDKSLGGYKFVLYYWLFNKLKNFVKIVSYIYLNYSM